MIQKSNLSKEKTERQTSIYKSTYQIDSNLISGTPIIHGISRVVNCLIWKHKLYSRIFKIFRGNLQIMCKQSVVVQFFHEPFPVVSLNFTAARSSTVRWCFFALSLPAISSAISWRAVRLDREWPGNGTKGKGKAGTFLFFGHPHLGSAMAPKCIPQSF